MARMTIQHAATSLISLAFGRAYELLAQRISRGGKIDDATLREIEAEAIAGMRQHDLSTSPLDGEPEQARKMAEDMLSQAFAAWRRERRMVN